MYIIVPKNEKLFVGTRISVESLSEGKPVYGIAFHPKLGRFVGLRPNKVLEISETKAKFYKTIHGYIYANGYSIDKEGRKFRVAKDRKYAVSRFNVPTVYDLPEDAELVELDAYVIRLESPNVYPYIGDRSLIVFATSVPKKRKKSKKEDKPEVKEDAKEEETVTTTEE